MNILPLETERQVLVGHNVARALLAERATPLTPGVLARGDVVVGATLAVSQFTSVRPMTVNRAIHKVVLGFEQMIALAERSVLDDRVIPRDDAQSQLAAHLRRVRAHVFSGGTDFVRESLDVQWKALAAIRGRMEEPETAAAIDAAGVRPYAQHVLAHIRLFGRMLGEQGGGPSAGEAQANDAWTEAFRELAAQVLIDYPNDAAMQEELLGSYAVELEQQQQGAARTAPKRR